MRRPLTALVAASVVLAGLALGVGPVAADGPGTIEYDCESDPGGLGSNNVSVDIFTDDAHDPVAPGGQVVAEIEFDLPDVPSSASVAHTDRFEMRTPLPPGVDDAEIAIVDPLGAAANPPTSTWSGGVDAGELWVAFQAPDSDHRIGLEPDGTYVYPADSDDPVVPPELSVTADVGDDAADGLITWYAPDVLVDVVVPDVLAAELTCIPDDEMVAILDTAVCGAPTFSDVGPANRFYCEIDQLAVWELTTGFADGTFRPSVSVSRQAMAAFLYRLANSSFEAGDTPSFSDVGPDSTFFDEIEWMAETGLSTGFADGSFRPAVPVSRQAMAAFMYRFAEATDEASGDPTFSDVDGEHPFFTEIEWMADEEISTGFDDGSFRPSIPVTRQAMAAFLVRLVPLLP